MRGSLLISIIVCGAPSVDDGIMDIGLILGTSSKIFLLSLG